MKKTMLKYSFCRQCSSRCGIELEVTRNEITRINGDVNHPSSKGYLCKMGAASLDIHNDPSRLQFPLKRIRGELNRISWDTALSEMGDIIRDCRKRNGKNSIACFFGNQMVLSYSNFIYGFLFPKSLDTIETYGNLTLCCSHRLKVAEEVFGSGDILTVPDLDNTNCLLLFGSNPLVSKMAQLHSKPNPLSWMKEIIDRGGKIIIVDPVKTESVKLSSIFLQIVPGTDVYLVFSMIKHIIENDIYDHKFVSENLVGFDTLREVSGLFDTKITSDITGLSERTIIQTAELFATSNNSVAIGKSGIGKSRYGTLTEWGITVLNAITGNLDKEGGTCFNKGVFSSHSISNKFKRLFNRVPDKSGDFSIIYSWKPSIQLADNILNGKIKILIVDAGNPLLSLPNRGKVKNALKKLEMLVVIDILKSETADYAHYVLPAKSWFEHEDLTLFTERVNPRTFVQYSPKIVDARYEEKNEWEIFHAIMESADIPFFGSKIIDIAFKTFNRLGKPMRIQYNPMIIPRILMTLGGKISLEALMEKPHGLEIKENIEGNLMKSLAFNDKKIRISPTDFVQKLKEIVDGKDIYDPEYPFTLVSRKTTYSINTIVPRKFQEESNNEMIYVHINENDAKSMNIEKEDKIIVESRSGMIQLLAKPTSDIREGVISICFAKGAGKNEINFLVGDDEYELFTGIPLFNQTSCRITKKK